MKLCEIAGLTHPDKLLTLAATDNVVLGICTNRGCVFTIEVESDQRGGYCDWCEDNTVQSVLVLADLI